MNNLKEYLDEMVDKFNTPDFITNDPIQFPKSFHDKQDVEIAAFLTATIAWGNRKMILKSCEKLLFDLMKGQPYQFVMSEWWREIDPAINIHRTFFGRDLIYLSRGLHAFYKTQNSLESLFCNSSVWESIRIFREHFCTINEYSTKHISNPVTVSNKVGSACKRLNMMLRWLCRNDGIVDMGIWKNVKPSDLMIPLDVHVARIGRELGLIDRKANDRTTVEQLTAKLRTFCPQDPIKYDFALFGVGEADYMAGISFYSHK